MNAHPIAKILTVVGLVLFTSLSWGQETQQVCIANKARQLKKENKCSDKTDDVQKKACRENADEEAKSDTICAALLTSEERKEIKRDCSTAFDSYKEVSSKAKEACNAFDKAGGSSCDAKVKSCSKKIDNVGKPFSSDEAGDENGESGASAMKDIAMASIFKNMGISNTAGGSSVANACVKSIDRKARAQDKKDKDRERKDLLDKIKAQKDDIEKQKEDLDKQRNESSEKTAELEAENKKDILDKDKKISEKTQDISKAVAEAGKRMRGYSLAVVQETQKLATTNFEFQTAMLELAFDKVDQKCKSEFDSLKAGIVNSKVSGGAPAGASPDQQKEYAALSALAAQYKAKGIRGTGELRAMLLSARKACYERANTARNKNKMANAQSVQTIQGKIDEYKNMMNDEKKGLEDTQKNIETMKGQIDKEKQADEAAKLTKLDNLNKKLTNQVDSTNRKVENANTKIKELNAEIAKQSIVEKFEVEDAYSEAEEAIDKGNLTRGRALSQCNCENKPSTDQTCSILNEDKQLYDGKKVKSATKASK